MKNWVKCTNVGTGDAIFVNMSTAACIVAVKSEGCTFISYPGDDTPVKVQETPELIILAAGDTFSQA